VRLFYEAPGVRLYLGDCREAMSVLGEKLFSLTLADPPYEQTSLSWDSWPEGWLQAAHGWRAANGSLWCWGTLRLFMERAAEFTSSKWRLAQDTIWEKHNGSQPGGDRFLRVHEQAAHFYPVASRWSDIYREPQLVTAPPEHAHKRGRVVRSSHANAGQLGKHKPSTYVDTGMRAQRSVWHVRSMHRQGGGSATPKPPGVLEPIIRYSCPPGGWVLVPFVGGGAEVAAALRLGRNVVGFDVSEAELSKAVKRLSQGIIPGLTE
jgi:site-specific DNA-methyltransferase (adenine-specific)